MAGRINRSKRKRENTDMAMALANSGDAHASDGGVAVTGFLRTEQLTVVQHRAVREPATWPHQVGVIPSPAQSFQHREQENLLGAALDRGGTAVLVGMGGVGKTQIAAAYARSAWQNELDILVWVTGGDRSAIVNRFAQAGIELCRADPDNPERAAEAFLAWLVPRTGSRLCKWLIVLDDVADPNDLRGLWPPSNPQGRTVVTTRRRDAALITEARPAIEVGLFSPTEAVSYLTASLSHHRRVETAEQLTALASELGYLPLALAQAAAYLIDSGIATGAYRELLADQAAPLVDTAPARLPDDQTTLVAAAWALSIERADQLSPVHLARPMLQLAAMLDSNGIPQEIFTSGPALFFLSMCRGREEGRERASWRRWWPVLRPVAVTQEEAVGALRVLHRLNLIDYPVASANASIRVHQLIQRVTRDSFTSRQHNYLGRLIADALFDAWPEIDRDTLLEQALRANTSSLMAIASDALFLPRPHKLLYRMGESLGQAGDVAAVASHYAHVADVAARHHGEYHLSTIAAQHGAAMWQGLARDKAGSVIALEDLLMRMLIVRGENHPSTLTILHDLAVRRGEGGDAEGAAAALAKVVDRYARLLGEAHPNTLIAQGNLAKWRGEAGDAAGAVAALSVVTQHMAEILGRDHPNTFVARSHLAGWIGEAGAPEEAVAAFVSLFDDHVRVYGPEHRETLKIRECLAVWRGQAGDISGAIGTLNELHGDSTRILGPEDPGSLGILAHLAYWQGKSGDAAGAVEILTELLEIRIRMLGSGHPKTINTENSLAFWRGELERIARQ